MKAINIACPSCKAEPGAKCRDIGYADEPRAKSGHHVSRVRRARYETTGEARAKHAADKATTAAIAELKRST